MKKSKVWKLAAFAALFVLVVAGAMKMTATAGAIPTGNVTVDYSYETVTVETTEDSVIYFTDKYNKDITRWDVCDVRDGKAVFDISWITSSKTVRLYLCGDVQTDVISVDLTWEETMDVKFTGTLLTTDITEAERWKEVYEDYENFSEDTGYLIFTIEENGRDMSYFELENIEWRKGDDGVWRDFKELDLREMNIKGIKLEFRVMTDNDEGTRASTIGKINLLKLSGGPDIVVNSDTMTVALKNGQEVSFDKEEWILIPSYDKKYGSEDYLVTEDERAGAISEISTNRHISGVLIQELMSVAESDIESNTQMNRANLEQYNDTFNLTDEGIVVYVRTAGTSSKAASRISEVVIPYADATNPAAKEADVAFSHSESKTATGGIVVENKSDLKYQIGIITPEDAEYAKIGTAEENNIDISEVKWTSIKGGKMMKLAFKKVPENSWLIYRIAGEDGKLPSTYKLYGPIEYNVLTYAGIDSNKKTQGDELTAVVSTNLVLTDPTLKFQWQRCADIKADEPVWTDIGNATGSSYTLTYDDGGFRIRVKITQEINGVTMVSDDIGPVKATTKPEETPGAGTN